MTHTTSLPRRTPWMRLLLAGGGVAAFGLGFWIVGSKWPQIAAAGASGRGLHPPDLGLLLAQPPVVIAHATLAFAALLLGPALLLSRKGASFHRAAGWSWAGLMAAVAISSLFIVEPGEWSYIHIMSGLTLLLLPVAVHAARRHAVVRHRALMMWLFFVMLLGAAAFTLVPGRLVWRMFFG